MSKKVAACVLVFLAVSTVCLADTIYLKNGKQLQGQVVEKSDQSVVVNMKGVNLTYDLSEGERIDRDSASAPVEIQKPKPFVPSAGAPAGPEKPVNIESLLTQPSTVPVGTLTPDASVSSMGKNELIISLIEASGAKASMNQIFTDIITKATPQEAQQLKGILNIDEVVTQLIPVYDKYFSEGELKELVMFYKSALGQKLLQVTPLVMEDSMKASAAYFQNKLQPAQGQ